MKIQKVYISNITKPSSLKQERDLKNNKEKQKYTYLINV